MKRRGVALGGMGQLPRQFPNAASGLGHRRLSTVR